MTPIDCVMELGPGRVEHLPKIAAGCEIEGGEENAGKRLDRGWESYSRMGNGPTREVHRSHGGIFEVELPIKE
jgi:hypothetical protein